MYPAWELCIADDASSEPTVRAVLEECRALDARIKVAYRAQNGHISRATNSALELATGEFAVLLDHDDELAEDALYWVAREIVEFPSAMLIYSDEDKVNGSGIRFDPYFKPDWNPELLRAQNCISHLGAFRTEALRAIGGFRAGLEGAQDWDVALRLSERCEPVAGQLASSLGVEFELIHFPAATGLGVAWNAACNGCTGELIVLLVAGISGLTPGWCERLVGYAQNADCGVVAPALLSPDGRFHNAGILLDAELGTVRAFLGRQKEYWLPGARQALAQNLTVPGSEFLAFRREVHTAIGGFDTHFSDRDLLAADF